jgi:hypothetical protein
MNVLKGPCIFEELFLKLEWKEPSNVVLTADGETCHSGFLGASLLLPLKYQEAQEGRNACNSKGIAYC